MQAIISKASDAVVKYLVEAIIKGRLKPGDKVPSTQILAQVSGTSIVSAREAVQSLAVIGILEISHGRGIFLTEGAPVIEELLEARKVLESHNAMMAAQNIDLERLKILENLLKQMKMDAEDGDIESYSQKDIEFHFVIAQAAGNRILFKTLMNIRNLLHYQLFTINRFPKVIQKSSARHSAIFDSLRKRDPEQTRLNMWLHITETVQSWKEYSHNLQQQEGPEFDRSITTHFRTF